MTETKLAQLVAVVGLLLWPTAAIAQSAIAGQVRDNTGGVLPGVTVESGSPALIEGSRTSVTDGQGRFEIVGLRPGTYRLTFTLEGFTKLVREGIELPSSFTATVDAMLNVGNLQETVTVTGQGPLVDVQQTQQSQVLSRDVIDVLPTGRSLWSLGAIVAGVAMSGTDVGGSQGVSDLMLEAHGASAAHTVWMVDGLMVNSMQVDGIDQGYYQDLANEEVVYSTSGGSAEASAGGVRLNMIPKDGGNQFRGQALFGGSPGAWQSDNFSQRLKDLGIRAINRIDRIFEYSGAEGGPILRNRLWFFSSFRALGVYTPTLDAFVDDGRQYVSQDTVWSIVSRITFQPTIRNKLSLHFDRQVKGDGTEIGAKYPVVIIPGQRGADPETARKFHPTVHARPFGITQAKWTSPLSNRVLVDAGYGFDYLYKGAKLQPGVEQEVGTPDWYRHVPKTDLDLGTSWEAAVYSRSASYRHVVSTSASYVTGTHNMKVGAQLMWGSWEQYQTVNGHLQQVRYRSGVPDAVVVGNYPNGFIPRMNHDNGLYAQDSWTMGRLTMNGGIRMDWLNSQVDENTLEAGRFVGERHFAKVENVPNWFDVSPRFGVAFDVFGDSKTALKFSVGKYVRPHTTSLAIRMNPAALTAVTIPWNDRDVQGRSLSTNGDDIAQDNELDLTRLPTNFGYRQLDRIDPNLQREYNIETGITLQRQLLSNMSTAVGWYRRTYHDRYLDDNVQRDFNDYVPVEIVSPYNGEVITAYNLKSAAKLSLVDTLVTNAGKDRSEIYNGFEISTQARFARGGILLGSLNIERVLTNECDQPDNPNLLRFCDRNNLPAPYNPVSWDRNFKLSGSHPLGWGVQASAKFTSMVGRGVDNVVRFGEDRPILWNISRTTRYTAAGCAGRPCTPGALVIPGLVESSLVVPLAPPGTERWFPRVNQLDLGVDKTFKARGAEYHAKFELFNTLNSDVEIGDRTDPGSNYGTPSYGVPTNILQGRLPRLSVQIKW